jgi:hypothetical protein
VFRSALSIVLAAARKFAREKFAPAVFAPNLEITFNPADGSAAHFLTSAETQARQQAQANSTGVPPAPEFSQDPAESNARRAQIKQKDLYAIIFH